MSRTTVKKYLHIFQTCGKSYEEIMGLEDQDQDLYLLFQEPDRGGYFHRIVHYQHEFGKRNLLGRFGRMFCHSDIINYGNLHDIDFQRTQTLCQGGQKCDFCFVRHRKGEVWKRSESI